MQIGAHFALSWFAGEAAGLDRPLDRRIIALAGVAPDVDAVAYPAAYVWFGFDLDRAYSEVWEVVHHRYTHGIGFALVTAIVAFSLARTGPGYDRRALAVGALAALVSLAHVFCDVIGAGPGWPVHPLWPLSDVAWGAPWSWNVSEWPNAAFTFAGIAAALLYARVAGRSPIETFSGRLDDWVVGVMRGEATVEPGSARRLRIVVYAVLALASAIIVAPLIFGLH